MVSLFHNALDLSYSERLRRTKIIATLGPASSDIETIGALLEAGVNVFRLNFSHGDHDTHRQTIENIRLAKKKWGRHVAIMGDLCGPKIRVGRFENGHINLVNGSEVKITTRKIKGNETLIPCEYAALHTDVSPGDAILLADGTRKLEVVRCEGEDVTCRVIAGGVLSDRKGINLPGVKISTPSFTEKDRRDAAFACEQNLDFLALSFVRSASDVSELKGFIAEHGGDMPVVSKIEKLEALQDIDAILEATDIIMIARGDLGVEMPAEDVPLVQRELTKLAIDANVPVIVATQMLESMITQSSPTRAEVTDVAWAAMASADAVMLSAETAVGKHPIQAVRTMARVTRLIESYQISHEQLQYTVQHKTNALGQSDDVSIQVSEALARSTAKTAKELDAYAIAVGAVTGTTARMISAERPVAPILGMATDPQTCDRLCMYWGVTPLLVPHAALQAPDAHLDALLDKAHIHPHSDRATQYVILVTVRDYEHMLNPSLRIIALKNHE